MASRRNVGYSPLNNKEIDDDANGGKDTMQHDPRFAYAPKSYDKIPWNMIALALFLLSLGCLLLFLSCFILTGHVGGDHTQAYGLMTLGVLAFVPGFYETRFAYYSWRGAKGYGFSYIPTY